MKKLFLILFGVLMLVQFSNCTRVNPNEKGVLIKNWGRDGYKDFEIVSGLVAVWQIDRVLFKIPAYEQRGGFEEPIVLKSADNTEFQIVPRYTYKIIPDSVMKLVFNNMHLDEDRTVSGKDGFLLSLENNVLEPILIDKIREESRQFTTDTLMSDRGSLMFEKRMEDIVEREFQSRGLKLLTFSCQLEFSQKVKQKIENRNEVNQNLAVLDQQIEEQKKRNELQKLQAEEQRIKSAAITKELLQQQFIEKWDGHTPLYGLETDYIHLTK